MAASTQPAGSRQPPVWLFKHIVNPTMKTILRSPLHGILSKGLMILTFTGRTSGKRYSTPVAYHELMPGTLIVMTRSPWWKNFRNGEPITVRVKGKVYGGKPEIILDNEVVWGYITRFLQQHNNPRQVGIMLPAGSSQDQIRQAAADLLAIKIDLM